MPTIKQFLLPDPAEGLTEAEIVSWLVGVGDQVALNQAIVEIETAKSVVELPSPYSGVVVDIHVPAGQVAQVGTPIISIDVASPEFAGSAPAPSGRQPVLVGYGPKESTPHRRRRRAWPNAFGPGSPVAQSAAKVLDSAYSAERPVSTPVAPPRPPRPVTPVPREHLSDRSLPDVGQAPVPGPPPDVRARPRAKPPVRKLARDLGLDLDAIDGSGVQGLVTRQDVQSAATTRDAQLSSGPSQPGDQERLPIKGVRKATAEAMVASAFSAPHVTVWVSVNVTRSIALVERLRARPEFADTRITMLALVAKALCMTVSRHPLINARWDEAAGDIVLNRFVNLGIAVSTRRGLLVPNVVDAHRCTLPELAGGIEQVADQARSGHLPLERMRGGTITITNVGVFGVDGGTPIINPPESAILAMGQVRPMPWVVEGAVAVADVMQLSLSFDHRLIDGEVGARALADIAALLESPDLALAW